MAFSWARLFARNGVTFAEYYYNEADDIIDLDHNRPAPSNMPTNAASYPAYINGWNGNDTLVGSNSSGWIYDGGAGIDTFSGANYTAGIKVDLLTGEGPKASTVVNVENIVGTAWDDILKGNHLANKIDGGAGNDVVDGSAGADTLYAGAGNDTILTGWDVDQDRAYGGAGDDIIYAGDGDVVSGGAGADQYRFDPRMFGALITSSHADYSITQFEHGIDKIVVPKGWSAMLMDSGVRMRSADGAWTMLVDTGLFTGIMRDDLIYQS